MNRRQFLISSTAAALPLAAAPKKLRVGVMDGILGKLLDPAAMAAARRLGFDGVQLTIGRKAGKDEPMPLADPALQARFLAESKAQSMPIASTYIDILHVNCLKNDKDGLRRTAEGIDITRRLGAPVLMLVFFGDCALQNRADMDAVVGPLKELAPLAQKAGVVLGFENVISAEDNMRVLDQVGSPALKVYYDIGNATNMGGFEPAKEIRMLGRERLCQFHVKDRGYLGAGKVDVKAAVAAIREIGFEGYLVLETGSPSKDVEADLRRNLDYLNGILG